MVKKIYFPIIVLLVFAWSALNAQTQRTNLPTIYINTENQLSIDSKDEYDNATLTSVSAQPTEELAGAGIQIRGRGNSTWRMPKKSYRIKFTDKLHFLNLPAKEDDWVLLANYADKTLMRNAVAFQLSQLLGFEWTPSAKFVDLVINGEFMGNYMVSDQVERKNDRVPLEKLDPSMVSLPDISGGYLLESDGFADGAEQFKTSQGLNIVIKYPDDDDINDSQRQYISAYTQEFEDALFSGEFKDGQKGYRAYVDVPSLVNYYIVSEFTGNSDAFWSTYFYKKRNDPRFKFGPVWDFDIAFNNDQRLGDATEKLMKDAAHNPKQWIRRFLADQELENEIARRWAELKGQGILEQLLAYVDKLEEDLEASQEQNFERWDILNNQVYLELEARGTYEAEVEFLRNYLVSRYEFLDSQWKVKVPTAEKALLAESEDNKLLVPASDIGASWKADVSYDDASWATITGYPAGIGYEQSAGYEQLITHDVGPQMFSESGDKNTSCYIRMPFSLQELSTDSIIGLKLMLYYDDGFIAYLNGTKVHEVNAPADPQWSSTATGQHEAQSEDIIDLSGYIHLLKEGENLLAIHALNAGQSSSDFIIAPRLFTYSPISAGEDGDGDNNGEDDDDDDEVVTSGSGVFQQEQARLWPNPVVDAASVSFYLQGSSKVQLSIYDQRGRLVKHIKLTGNAGLNTVPLSVSKMGIASGLYEIKVIAGMETVFSEKMLVMR